MRFTVVCVNKDSRGASKRRQGRDGNTQDWPGRDFKSPIKTETFKSYEVPSVLVEQPGIWAACLTRSKTQAMGDTIAVYER